MHEEFDGSEPNENLDLPPAFFPYEEAGDRPETSFGDPVEVEIEGLFAQEGQSSSRFVLLSDGQRKLTIMIGPYEANAILHPLEHHRPDRPMTHDLIKTFMDRLGATVDRVVIDDLWNKTYYAKIYVKHGKEEIEIDARPSDSIAIAVRFEAPIFVLDGILDAALEE